ncbi:S41 family peptidase [Turicimonas muris]|uniref:S41 family peptidase n=1 Tax=Turicimonas muris TaxID=1796652 RepID=UPI0026F3E87D|nr:S41 family peptidase [Turicimonas muris]
MKSGIRGIILVSVGMIAGAVIGAVTAEPVANKKTTLPLSEIYGAVKQFYVEPVSDKKLMKEAISGMLHGLDPHSAFLDEESFKELQEGTMGEFGGLGIEVTSDPAGVKVVSPIDDTPAANANVRAGDVIYKIDGKLIRDVPLNDAVKMMRGKPNTQIDLSILRKGEKAPLNIKLTRAIIKVKSVKFKALPDHMGYVRISQFQERTNSELAKAINELAKTDNLKNGLVLDLRNDPGGLLNAAVGVSAVFLPKGVKVVSTKGQVEEAKKDYLTVPADYRTTKEDDLIERLPPAIKNIPLVVLVNGASASASEIVAGALQDHKRAAILGTKTFGKGSVQTVIPLRGDAKNMAIKLTTARYFTPTGRSIQAKGIVPDVEVKDTAEGNFLDFDIREADLANHLEVEDTSAPKPVPVDAGKQKSAGQIKEKVVDEKGEEKKPAPKFYKYGEPDDYQLQQAVKYLKEKPNGTKPAKNSRIKERIEPINQPKK